jgi:hypothetical protein
MESTVSIAKLVLPAQIRRRHDPDAAAYIASVETADGQSLEQGIKDAITGFVVGCKIRGIWDSIKSCCLLCGARTQAGAIVPLKGNAPILTNFVGDYNRENGLRRTSGTFDINRNNNVDPQNSKHVAVYPTSIDYGTSTANFRSIIASGSQSGGLLIAVTSAGLSLRCNTSLSAVGSQPVAANGLIGVSVLNSSQSQVLYNQNIGIVNIDTTTPSDMGIRLWSGSGLATSTTRLAFYSVGESLNLKTLNEVVKNYINRLKQLFYPSSIHPDVTKWIQRHNQLASSPSAYLDLSSNTLNALNAFCNSIHSNNLRDKIYRLNLFMGPNLFSARIPFYLGPDDNTFYGSRQESVFNFSEGLYNPEIGLIGNGTSSYIESGLPTSLLMDIFPSTHLSYYCTNVPANNNSFIKTILSTQQGWALGSNGALTNRIGRNSILLASSVGSRILSRTSESSLCLYDDGILASCNNATTTVPNYNFAEIRILASRIVNNSPAEFNNGSYGGYSIGLGLDETEASNFANIMKTFQQSIGRI